MPDPGLKCAVFVFQHNFPLGNQLSWENIWFQGDKLLKALTELRSARADKSLTNRRLFMGLQLHTGTNTSYSLRDT